LYVCANILFLLVEVDDLTGQDEAEGDAEPVELLLAAALQGDLAEVKTVLEANQLESIL
jgi:hypothetical protein